MAMYQANHSTVWDGNGGFDPSYGGQESGSMIKVCNGERMSSHLIAEQKREGL